MSDHVVLTAKDLDGYLTDQDRDGLRRMHELYDQAIQSFEVLSTSQSERRLAGEKTRLIELYNQMGALMQEITGSESAVRVYSFETPKETHGEVSRLIAKLRDRRTQHSEFLYYVQRAYELLFNFSFGGPDSAGKNHLIVRTPVDDPVQNFAVHKIPDVDSALENSVMCVMLRGALLPSIMMSKEIQEYTSTGYVTPFALFRIRREESRKEADMEYVLDLQRSFFDLETLDGKDLIFADPMNATAGSLVTIVQYLRGQGVRPRSIQFINIIAALKGALRTVRALGDASVSTLWMDPVLNEAAFILPGLGDAGDRLNGADLSDSPRNIIQLIADYGATIANLYRAQIREIERTVLGL